jgi:hypothetical protein
MLASIQWAFWALLMMPLHDMKKCYEFYLEYAKGRMDMYFKLRLILLGDKSKLIS